MSVFCYSFLFDSGHPDMGGDYGTPCIQKIIKALEQKGGQVSTAILRGDIILEHISEYISSVGKRKLKYIGRNDTYETISINRDLYITSLCDLSESLLENHNRFKTNELELIMARSRVYAITLTSITMDLAIEIDNYIKNFPPYIGMSSVDTSNPLQWSLLINYLIDGYAFSNGKIECRIDPFLGEEDQNEIKNIAEWFGSSFPPSLIDHDEFNRKFSKPDVSRPFSERGQLSIKRIFSKHNYSHRQKILDPIIKSINENTDEIDIEFTTTLPPEIPEFEVEEIKLKEYLLNINHEYGKSKAIFFKEILGISIEDWLYLKNQIEKSMKKSEVYKVEYSKYGFRHRAFINITGINGQKALLETGWELREGKSARLITAYPADKKYPLSLPDTESLLVDRSLTGDAKWEAIYNAADKEGRAAADSIIPTPMKLEGYSPIWEGACGFGWVIVSDARKDMGRWLRKNKIGYLYRPGVQIFSPIDTQSIDRNFAYAKAFADVLIANNVKCEAFSRLD